MSCTKFIFKEKNLNRILWLILWTTAWFGLGIAIGSSYIIGIII